MPVVKLFAGLRKAAGMKEVSVTADSVGGVVSELVARYPALAESLFENGQIRQHVIFTINGHHTSAMDTPVKESDQIAIFPPIGGG